MKQGARSTREEHEAFRARLAEIESLADSIGEVPIEELRPRLLAAHDFLAHEVMPHAVAEGVVVLPLIRRETGERTLGVRMTQCHVQLSKLVDELEALIERSQKEPSRATERDLGRVLYGVTMVLSAHLAEADAEVEPLLDATLSPDERETLFAAVDKAAHELADLYE